MICAGVRPVARSLPRAGQAGRGNLLPTLAADTVAAVGEEEAAEDGDRSPAALKLSGSPPRQSTRISGGKRVQRQMLFSTSFDV